MGFYLYTGNKLERLADQFREHVYAKTGELRLTPETVVVQTQGMAAWLRLKLAESAPVAANLDFPFLHAFISSVLERVFPEYKASVCSLSKERMAWRIFHIFMDHPDAYPELEAYFSHDTGEADLKKYQLAEKIAGLFDQYQIYRGDILEVWRSDPGQGGWQARLYLELAGNMKGIDGFFRDFLALRTLPDYAAPEHVSVFGISAMAPVYLQFFVKLAEFRNVHFFYVNPCEDFWSDVLSWRQAAKLSRKIGTEVDELADGNPLLASLGTRGRDFFSLIMEIPEACISRETTCFEPFSRDRSGMLGTIQQDIQDNQKRGCSADGNTLKPLVPAKEDQTITVHNCHSALRETEVLHDRLLALLQNEHIQPRDIIVMAPDISVYEPYVNAVFGTGPLKEFYAFSDRSIKDVNQTASAFLSLLKLRNGKYETSAVFDLLEHPAIRRKWELSDTDLDRLRQWVSKSGIRWGINAENREELCGVGFDEYSWEQGLDRLLLGYAVLRDEAEQGREEVISLDTVEGNEAETLGAFIHFVEALFSLREHFDITRGLPEWCEFLSSVLDDFFLNDSDSYLELSAIRRTLQNLSDCAKELNLSETLSPELILFLLENGFGKLNAADPFLHGGITFCSLVPMRSIPMKVVAILGLNEGTFPRRDTAIGFSLLARHRRRLDPSANLEDRYLFLESILAAREHLLLFYQGRDNRGEEAYPPASPLAELLDTLGASFGIDPKKIEIIHKLQAFDFAYFNRKNPALFSFSEVNFHAAEALAAVLTGNAEEPSCSLECLPSCASAPLPEILPLQELEDFFRASQAYYLKHMAGLLLRDGSSATLPEQEDDEPLVLDSLEKYTLEDSVTRWTLDKIPAPEQYHILKKTNRLPVGAPGKDVFHAAWETAKDLPSVFQDLLRSAKYNTLELRLDEILLSGEIMLDPSGLTQVYFRSAKFKGADAIRWYLRHLLLSAAQGSGVRSLAWNREKASVLFMSGIEPSESRDRLRELLAIFQRGQTNILPIFKEASFAYALHGESLSAARGAFFHYGSDRKPAGDWANDKAIAEFFTPEDFDSPAFEAEFAEYARILFRPFLYGEVKNEE